MAHEYRYILTDLLTETKLGSLPLYGVNFTNFLTTAGQTARYGQFTGTIRADTPGYTVQEILACTIPLRTALYVERDGQLVWGGFITTRTYQSQSLTYQIQAETFDGYLAGAFYTITTDLTYNDDPRNIIWDVWNYWQGIAPQCNIGMVIPGNNGNPYTLAGNLVTQTITATEDAPLTDAITNACQAGAEYRVDVYYDIFGKRIKQLTLGRWDQPQSAGLFLGTNASPGGVSLEYPGQITSYTLAESGTKSANYVIVMGKSAGTGSTALTVVQNNPPNFNAGWPVWGFKLNQSQMTDVNVVTLMANRLIQQLQPPFVTPTFTLAAGAYGFGDFALGDMVYVAIDDPYRFPDKPFATHYRVVSTSLSPETDNTPEIFGFVIDQPNPAG